MQVVQRRRGGPGDAGREREMLKGEGKEAPTAGRSRGAAAAAAAGGRTEGTRRRAGSKPDEQTRSVEGAPIVGSDFCERILCVCVCVCARARVRGARGKVRTGSDDDTSRAKIQIHLRARKRGQTTKGDRGAGRGAGESGRKERLKDETEKDGARRREREKRREKERDEERSKASVQRQCATSNHRLSFPPPYQRQTYYHCYPALFYHRLLFLSRSSPLRLPPAQ